MNQDPNQKPVELDAAEAAPLSDIDIEKLPPHLREMWDKAGQRRDMYLSQFEADKAKAKAARNRMVYRLQIVIIALIVYASRGGVWFWLFLPAGLTWIWYSRRLLITAAKTPPQPPDPNKL